jgi:hypothetical protein
LVGLSVNNLLVDAKNPRLDVGVVIVRDVVDGEDGTVFFRGASLGPEGWELLLEHTERISVIGWREALNAR